MGQGEPREVPVVVTRPDPESQPGRGPHMAALLTRTRRVRAVIAVHWGGMVPVSELNPRFSRRRLVRVLHCGGKVLSRPLVSRSSSVRAVSSDQTGGNAPVSVLPDMERETSPVTWLMAGGREVGKPKRSRAMDVGMDPEQETPLQGEAKEQGSGDIADHVDRELGELSWDLTTRRALYGVGGG